uniref:Uncharacterized protein n=1 Tax=Melanopsichium pennsylvanicum 4 TaxID=1398559 RepID=A0A077R8S8_9BASI|nr:conserved hypothetical protein (N-terminal fragment) [Melanopsichium pennsylvanicum 4]
METIPKPHKQRESLRIDVPMRAFTGGYYPQLLALYRHLGITLRQTNFTYSFASFSSSASSWSNHRSRSASPDRDSTAQSKHFTDPTMVKHEKFATPSPTILYNGANGVRGVSVPSKLANFQIGSAVRISDILCHLMRLRAYFVELMVLIFGYLQLLMIAIWHYALGHTSDSTHPLGTHTLRDLITDPFPRRSFNACASNTMVTKLRYAAERMSEAILRRIVGLDVRFTEQTLVPLFSAVMTCTLESVYSAPATEVLDYIALTLGKDHFVVNDGVQTVVSALLKHVDQAPPIAPSPSNSNQSRRSKVWTGAQVKRVQHKLGKAMVNLMVNK